MARLWWVALLVAAAAVGAAARESALVAGGAFTLAGGTAAQSIAAWDGVRWAQAGNGLAEDTDVFAMATFRGALVASSEVGAGYVLELDSARGVWAVVGGGVDSRVYSLLEYNGTLVVGGVFRNAGASPGTPARCLARWTGEQWLPFGDPDSTVLTLATYDGVLVAGGFFSTIGGIAANAIARWDGARWLALGSGVTDVAGRTGAVSHMIVFEGRLVVSGGFAAAGGVAAANVAAWDGATWSSLGKPVLGMGPLAVYDNALVGAVVRAVGDGGDVGSAYFVSRWTGSDWAPLGGLFGGPPEFNIFVYDLAVYADALYAGGSFLTASGVNASNIARWNGSVWEDVGGGFGGGYGGPYNVSYVGTLFAF